MPSFIPPKDIRNLRITVQEKTVASIMAEHVDNEDETNLFVLPDAQRDPTKGWSLLQRQEYIESLRYNLTSDQNWLINLVSASDKYELLDAGHRLETVKMFDRDEMPALDGRYLKDMSKKEVSYWKHKIHIKLCIYHDLTDEHKQVLFNRRNQGLSMSDGEHVNSQIFTSPFMGYLKYDLLPKFEAPLSRIQSADREKEIFTLFRLVNRILNPGPTKKSNKDLVANFLPLCEKEMQSTTWKSTSNKIVNYLTAVFHVFEGRKIYVDKQKKKSNNKNLYAITELFTVLGWFMYDFEGLEEFINLDTTPQKMVFKQGVQEFLLIAWKGLDKDDKTDWCEKWSHGADAGKNVDHSIKKTAALYDWFEENFDQVLINHRKQSRNITPKKRPSYRL